MNPDDIQTVQVPERVESCRSVAALWLFIGICVGSTVLHLARLFLNLG